MTPQERKAFAEQFKPAVKGKSDKFSWRLYQRMLKNGRERVYIMAWDQCYGKPFEPSLEELKSGSNSQAGLLMIGIATQDGWFHGSKLRTVCSAGQTTMNFAYGPGFNTKNWLDVTDWFWDAYLARGRCIIHSDFVHTWLTINKNSRKCAHCGKHVRRSVVTRKSIERIEVWS